MYKNQNNEWAEPVAEKGKYLTFDGQWWDGDQNTILFLKGLERPNRTSDQGRFNVPLTNERVIEVLENVGYIEKAA